MGTNNKFETTPLNDKILHGESFYRPRNEVNRCANDITHQNIGSSETKASQSSSSSIRKTQKKAEQAANITKVLFALVSVLVISITGVSMFGTKVKATFDWLEVSDTAVYYCVSFTDYEDNTEKCYVCLNNDFVNRVWECEMEENLAEGYFDGLQPNMYYTLSVKVGKSTILKQMIFTRLDRRGYVEDDYYVDDKEDDTYYPSDEGRPNG